MELLAFDFGAVISKMDIKIDIETLIFKKRCIMGLIYVVYGP